MAQGTLDDLDFGGDEFEDEGPDATIVAAAREVLLGQSARAQTPPKAPYAECWRCPLASKPYVPSAPVENAEVIAVGEAPGAQEVIRHEPFVGPSGQLLALSIQRAKHDPNRVYRTNAVLCRHGGDEELQAAIPCCAPRLRHELEEAEAPTILAMGTPAMNAIAHLAGREDARAGQPFNYAGKWVLPIRHPAYILRQPNEYSYFYKGIKKAFRGPTKHPVTKQPARHVLREYDEIADFLRAVEPEEWLSFDIETDQVKWYDRPAMPEMALPKRPRDKILMLAMAKDYENGYIIPATSLTQPVKNLLTQFFAEHDKTVAHNAKFDMTFLRNEGIHARCGFDTILAHYCLDENKGGHGLKILATEYFDVPDYEQQFVKKYLRSREDKYSKIPFQSLAQYAAWDVCITLALRDELEKELRQQRLWDKPFQLILMPLLEATTQVEMNGMAIDVPYLTRMSEELEERLELITEEMQEMTGDPDLNPNSSVRLQKLIFSDPTMPRATKKHVKPTSTSKAAIAELIQKLQDQGREIPPIIQKLQEYRRVAKILNTYVNPLLELADEHGRVHARFSLYGTETGRLTCTDPPLHTIPRPNDIYGRRIRGSFVAPPGRRIIIADFSQAELRAFAHLTQDPRLIEIFREGRDLHSEVTIMMFGPNFTKEQRRICKTFVFSFVYGGTEYSFAKMYQVPVATARGIVRQFTEMFPVAVQWRIDQFNFMKKHGCVESLFGRKRRFPFINETNVDESRKSACNSPVQSVASDVTQLAATALVKEGHMVVLTVQDSILVECDEGVAEETGKLIHDTMVRTGSLYIPTVPWVVDVEIGERWSKY